MQHTQRISIFLYYINPNANNKLHIANYLMNIPNKLSKKQKLVIRNKAIKRLQKEKQES